MCWSGGDLCSIRGSPPISSCRLGQNVPFKWDAKVTALHTGPDIVDTEDCLFPYFPSILCELMKLIHLEKFPWWSPPKKKKVGCLLQCITDIQIKTILKILWEMKLQEQSWIRTCFISSCWCEKSFSALMVISYSEQVASLS